MVAHRNAAGCAGEFAVLQRAKSCFHFLCGIVGGSALPAARSGSSARTTAAEVFAGLESYWRPRWSGAPGVRGSGEIRGGRQEVFQGGELAGRRGAAGTSICQRRFRGTDARASRGFGVARGFLCAPAANGSREAAAGGGGGTRSRHSRDA